VTRQNEMQIGIKKTKNYQQKRLSKIEETIQLDQGNRNKISVAIPFVFLKIKYGQLTHAEYQRLE
jgi:hypothetical protein